MVEVPKLIEQMPVADLVALKGFRGVEPNEVFGMDMENKFDELPPHAKSYGIVGSALGGTVADSWGGYGVLPGRERPEFRDFQAITEGLPIDQKVRFCVVLWQYLKDIAARGPDFSGRIEGEVLSYAGIWIRKLLASVDPAVAVEVSTLGIDELNGLLLEMPAEETVPSKDPALDAVKEALRDLVATSRVEMGDPVLIMGSHPSTGVREPLTAGEESSAEIELPQGLERIMLPIRFWLGRLAEMLPKL